MRIHCPFCNGVGRHLVRCPEYVPKQSNYTCKFCKERINIGEPYVDNLMGEYIHYDCITNYEELIQWLGFKVKNMEEEKWDY